MQDQIRLWELEKNRMKSQEGSSTKTNHASQGRSCRFVLMRACHDLAGYLYTAFASQADYEYVLNYAKQLGVVLWESSSRRCFFGTLEGHPNIRGFIERRTAGNA